MVGMVRAAVVRPGDSVVVTVERYLTGQQLAELQKHFQRRLPGIDVTVLHGGMEATVTKAGSDAGLTGHPPIVPAST